MGVLDGRRALITGGASGIGLATARRFIDEGASVVIVDLNAETGQAAAAESGARFVKCDVASSDRLADAFTQAEAALGGLDLVYLNAGVTTGQGDLSELTDEQYERIRGVNVDHVVFGVRESLKRMERGSIVCTASLAGLVAYANDPIYALTKHAVVGLVRGLGLQLAETDVTVNAICPGIVETPLVGADATKALRDAGFPLLEPEDIAEGVMRAITSGRNGGCWACQPGREPELYQFKGVPGPRAEGSEGMAPPAFRGDR